MNRRIIIRMAIILVALAGLLVASGAAIHGWCRTDAGRAWLAARLAGWASVSGEREVAIGRLDGDPFATFQIEELSVRDAEGVWLSVGSAEVRWRPWALLRGRVTVERLRAGGVRLVRAPAAAGGVSVGPPDLLRTMRGLRRYRLDDAVIEDLTLGPALLGEQAVLRVGASTGVADDAVRTSLTLERLDGVAAKAALTVAVAAFGDALDVDFRIDEPAGGMVARLLDVPGLPALHARLTGTGPPSAWSGNAKVAFDSFAALDMAFTVRHGARFGFDASGDAAFEGTVPEDAPAGLRDLSAVLGDRVAWQVAGEMDLRRNLLTVRRARLTGAFGALSGSGRYDFGKGAGTADMALGDHDLSRLAPLLGTRIEGRVDLSAEFEVEKRGASVAARVRGGARALATGQGIVDRLLTPTPRLSGRLVLVPGKLSMREVQVTSAAATLRLDGVVRFDEAAMTADYRLAVPDGVSVAVSDTVEIDCRCSAEGKLTGPLGDPHAAGNVTAAGMRVGGAPLSAPSLAYRLRRLASGPDGDLEGAAETPLGALAARTGLRFTGKEWRLDGLHAATGEATLDGALAIPDGGGPVAGTLRARLPALGPWIGLVGLEGAGKGDLRARLRAEGERQAAELTAELADVRIEGADGRPAVQAERVTVKAASGDLAEWKRMRASVDARAATIGELRLRRVSARASGSLSRIAVDATADGDWKGPASLRTKFVVTADARGTRIEVRELDGRALDETFRLTRALRVVWRRDGMAVEALALAVGKGRLTGRLRLRRDSVDGAVSVTDLPLRLSDRIWRTGLAGRMSAAATLRGTRRHPTGRLSATVTDLRLPKQSSKQGLSLSLKGDWRKGRFALNGQMSDAGGQLAQFSADLPLRLETDRWAPVLPPRAPISASLSWRGDAGALWRFVPLSEHQLAGPATMELRLGGSFSRPDLRGSFTVARGRYESLQLGTVLKDLDLRVDFKGARAEIARFAATDGNGGEVAVQGGMGFDAASGHPFDLRASFREFAILRRDEFEAKASGALRFKGTTRAAAIEGALEIDRAEIRVLERLPPDVVDLDVIELGGPAGAKPGEQPRRAPRFDPTLALTIDMPRRVFIRGRGLDSEWKGRISLAGTVLEPRLSGEMKTVRGQMSVVGKVFRLESGTVRFPDRPNASPVLDVTAVHEGRRLTAQAHVQGPVKNPTVTLTSTPPLPPDEIVSQILFDKGASKLTRVEAAQLAITLAQLSGKGGGAGSVMEFARKTLGVDVFRLESTRTVSGDEAATVRAGKYVTEDVFVGIRQGTTSESGSVGVEVEVTPNIVIESEVRQSGESDTSIKFKLDY